MLSAKIRIVTFKAVLLAALVAMSGHPIASIAQDTGKPDAKLKELQQERLAAARDCAKLVKERLKSDAGTVEELIKTTRLLLEGELDVCATDKECIAVLEKILTEATHTEKLAERSAKTGQGLQSTALMAKAERLRIEIALERAKAGKPAPEPGGAKDVQPKKGEKKVRIQAGTIEAFESVRLSARVSGVLKTQNVDIGDLVKRGQVLAVLDVPELETQLRMDTAVVDQAKARVAQAKARISGVEAELDASRAAVVQAEANVKGAAAAVNYRELTYQRMKKLFDLKSIDERVLDESKERHQAAVETENAARATVAVAKAQAVIVMAKIDQARADVAAREAGLKVAQAGRDKAQALFAFATITAPFDGVITKRSFSPGELIRSNRNVSLVTVQRFDRIRVVVSVPERDIPLIDQGNPVTVEVDAFPGKKWSAKVSRFAFAEDPKTRTMRVEVDMANSDGQIRPGMSAKVSIALVK